MQVFARYLAPPIVAPAAAMAAQAWRAIVSGARHFGTPNRNEADTAPSGFGLSRLWRRPHWAILIGGGIAGLIVVAVAVLSAWQLYTSDLVEAADELRRLDRVLVETTDRTIQGIDLVLGEIVKDLAADGIDNSLALDRRRSDFATHEMLRQKVRALPQLEALIFVNAAGQIVNFSHYWPIPGINLADQPYFMALRNDPEPGLLISAPIQSRATGKWTVYVGRRIDGQGGAFAGAVLGAIELHYFETFYQAVSPGPDSAIVLHQRDGISLARYPVVERAIGRSFADARSFAGALEGGSEYAMRLVGQVDGVKRIAAAGTLRNYPLIVNVSRSEDAVLAGWRSQALAIAAIAAAAVLAIGFLAAALIRHFRNYELLSEARADADRAILAQTNAEALAEAKSHFVATVSHELRTPLNAILGFSEIIKAQVFGPLGSPRYLEYAGDIHTSGRHLLDVVNDILTFAQAEANKLTIIAEPVDTADLVKRTLRMLTPQAATMKLTLTAEVADDLPPVLGDPMRLFQALVNLVANAIKFTPEHGQVTIMAEHRNDTIVVRVRDTGIGMAPEDIPKAMVPFGQVDSGHARRYEGTGLGLPLVKHFIELHGGTFTLDSVLGNGTEATVVLPVASLCEDEVVPAVAVAA
jgi:signal transduction histidine kinase